MIRPPDLLSIARLACAVVALALAAPGAAQPFPFTVVTETTDMAGERVKVDVYRPDGRDVTSVAVLAHGFTRDRGRARDLGADLAMAGVVAIAPDLPNVVDAWVTGEAVVKLVQALEDGALGLPPTPRSRIVLIGTSAGGLATLIAATDLPGLAGWIGLDPVDSNNAGVTAAKRLTAPAVVFLGSPSVCNLFGSGRTIAQAIPSLKRADRLRGASHCDFEGPTNNFCRTVCGRSPPGTAAMVRREAVETTLEMLRDAQVEEAPAQLPAERE